ncbi:MAG: hypothetical protein ACFCUO_03455 [Rhodospirillales bacterium]
MGVPLAGSRRRRRRPLVAAIAFGLVAGWGAVAPALGCERLRNAAADAAAHLRSVQQPSGLFAYGFDFATRTPLAGDNIVRQAGAAYALAEYYSFGRDDGVRASLIAALGALTVRSIAFAGGALVSADGTPGGARAGATALALLAELHFFRAAGDGRFADMRDAWERGLRALWRPGEGFRAGPGSRRTSDYFNGEIWLALAFLEATTEEPALAAWLVGVDGDLTAIYDRAPAIGFFHWGVMAAAERHARTGDAKLAAFARDQTRAYLRDLRPRMHATANTCYALEGLVTVRGLSDDGNADGFDGWLDRRIEAELAKNLDLMIRPGRPPLVGEGGGSFVSVDLGRYRGAFLAGGDRAFTRIDHTQHCLSALVRALRFGICPPAAAADPGRGRR